jgi:hypothetical protein
MEPTDWVAVYAAALSTAIFVRELITARQRRRPRVRVALSYDLRIEPDGTTEPWVELTVVNLGDRQIRVASLGLTSDEPKRSITFDNLPEPGSRSTLPGMVEPRDAGSIYIPEWYLEQRQRMDLFAPMVGWAKISTGERFESDPTVLLRRITSGEEFP